jgi:aryl-alcohol dehydrogenase-like predicted oxidoreductase
MTSGWGEMQENEAWAFEVLSKSLAAGVNMIDTAEAYGPGKAETILGKNLKQGGWDRDDLILTSKFLPSGFGIQGNSRKRIRQGMKNTLQRLQLDYSDVLFLHRFDPEVPLLESIRAVNDLIDEDYGFYWGTSMFSAPQLVQCHQLCDQYGLMHPIVEQCEYNLLNRKLVEVEYGPIFDHYGMGTTIWSALSNGILTGKYNDGNIPSDTRVASGEVSQELQQEFATIFANKEKTVASLQALGSLAHEIGCTQAELAIAWVLKSKDVSTVIFGVSKPTQLAENLRSVQVSKLLTPELLAKIEDIMQTRPQAPFDWRTMSPSPSRR